MRLLLFKLLLLFVISLSNFFAAADAAAEIHCHCWTAVFVARVKIMRLSCSALFFPFTASDEDDDDYHGVTWAPKRSIGFLPYAENVRTALSYFCSLRRH